MKKQYRRPNMQFVQLLVYFRVWRKMIHFLMLTPTPLRQRKTINHESRIKNYKFSSAMCECRTILICAIAAVLQRLLIIGFIYQSNQQCLFWFSYNNRSAINQIIAHIIQTWILIIKQHESDIS